MPIRPCANPTCPEPAAPGGSRCDEHRREYERERSRRRREEKDSKRDYRVHIHHTAKWINTRRQVIFDHPICQQCNSALSEHVHHVVPLTEGGDPYKLDGLQALCAPCHNRISAREQQARLGRVTVSEGWSWDRP